jgi:hypothetical protein
MTDDLRYDELVFATTHNSYSPGRGPIVQQLDEGVRGLELDVNRSSAGLYELGHSGPGNAVDHGGANPDSNDLADWLDVIARWSADHTRHAPITIVLDAKQALTDGASFALGNPAAMNAALRAAFGSRLLTPVELGARGWPRLRELRGRVLAVLSGKREGRAEYLRDGGLRPVVAKNGAGAVVEVHASATGSLWYWTGRYDDGRVTWARHGRCDGAEGSPSVALDDDGAVVVATGRQTRRGRLDEGSLEIDWERDPARADETTVALEATSGGRAVRVASILQDGLVETLVYDTDAVTAERIRYEQVMFVEGQRTAAGADHPPEIPLEERHFLAVKAGSREHVEWIRRQRREGQLVRLWEFHGDDGGLLVNFPATDAPRSTRYRDYLEGRPVAR